MKEEHEADILLRGIMARFDWVENYYDLREEVCRGCGKGRFYLEDDSPLVHGAGCVYGRALLYLKGELYEG